jgi:uncharacterized protein GlcG (DUF336 family)
MLDYKTLSLEDAQRAITAAIELARKRDHRGVAAVVVDKSGEIIAAARMDRMAPRFLKAAHRKAYTCAVFETDTKGVIAFWKRQEQAGHRGPHDWNDPMLTTLAGGYVVCYDGEAVGGIGIAGGGAKLRDEELATAAIDALGPDFYHRETMHDRPTP